jgi:hypothetical protein
MKDEARTIVSYTEAAAKARDAKQPYITTIVGGLRIALSQDEFMQTFSAGGNGGSSSATPIDGGNR